MVKGQRAEKGLIAQSDGGKSAANLLPAQMHWSYPKQQNIHLSKAPRDSPPLFVLPQLLSVSSVVNLLTAVNTMTLPKHTRQSLPSFCPTFCLCSLWSLISVQEGRMKRHRYCSIPAGKCCAALQLARLQRREGTLLAFPAASSNFSAAKHGAHFQKGMREARLLCEGKAREWRRCACREWMEKVKSHNQLHKMVWLALSLTAATVSNAGRTTALPSHFMKSEAEL